MLTLSHQAQFVFTASFCRRWGRNAFQRLWPAGRRSSLIVLTRNYLLTTAGLRRRRLIAGQHTHGRFQYPSRTRPGSVCGVTADGPVLCRPFICSDLGSPCKLPGDRLLWRQQTVGVNSPDLLTVRLVGCWAICCTRRTRCCVINKCIFQTYSE